MASIREGSVAFKIQSTGQVVQTWYRVAGKIPPTSEDSSAVHGVPLLTLHGGPGAASDYLRVLEKLVSHGGCRGSIPAVITYDQVGNGRSTHLPHLKGEQSFWTEDLFLAELRNLISHLMLDTLPQGYDLLGHSWGGCLVSRFAATDSAYAPASGTRGLRRLVISNSPASCSSWLKAVERLMEAHLPRHTVEVIKFHEQNRTTHDPEYASAIIEFDKKFVCTADPCPEELHDGMKWVERDPTVFHTIYGPSDLTIEGSLRDWNIAEDGDLGRIQAEKTLVINGDMDPVQNDTIKPFLDQIRNCEWVEIQTGHQPMNDRPEEYLKVVRNFLIS